MAIVGTWTKVEAEALQSAYQMNRSAFAQALGITDRYLRLWYSGARQIGANGQAALSEQLNRATPEVMARFEELLGVDPMQRRDFGRLAGTGALALLGLGTPSEQSEHAAWMLSGGTPSAKSIALVRRSLWTAMEMDDEMGAPMAQGQAAALQQVTEAMAQRAPSALLPELRALHAEATAFAGCVAWDSGDPVTAARLYHRARDIADEAEHDDLTAYSLCHLAQLSTSARKPRAAVADATAARGWVANTQDDRLRAYVALRAAEASALAGKRLECLALLDEAEAVLDGAEPTEPMVSRAYFVGVGLMASYRGSCLAILGDRKGAVAASQRAVDLMPADTLPRDRAVTLIELGRAHVALNDIEAATAAMAEAVDLSASQRSPRLHSTIAEERHHLAPWASSRAVRQLDERFARRDTVGA